MLNNAASIKKLSSNSAAGPDGVPSVLLKKCKSLVYPLLKLWKSSMETATVPEKTKLGIVKPIFKGGSKNAPKNYRPVSLTSHIRG